MRKFGIVLGLHLGLLFSAGGAFAKCAEMKHSFCVPVTFDKADPALKKKAAFPKHCAGMSHVKGESVGIVFQDEGACPKDGTSLVGHITSICQDTGPWTQAKYWFAGRAAFCTMSLSDRQNNARVIAGKIRKGMTRSQVREILKDYEFIGGGFDSSFSEQYYGHPDTVIEVPFEAPGGNYGSDNPVNGEVLIRHMEL